ncbi:MAG: tyrosine-type recombinase/integrase [Spirochaetaceae bacterium]|nr:tyrosine-type recombinase/integrase [Spirochaetaceae bacterium]
MTHDMERAGLAPRTRYSYILSIRLLAKFHGRSPDLLTAEDLKAWDDDLGRRGQSPSTRHVRLAAARFFFRRTLGRPEVVSGIVLPRRKRRSLPTVLSPQEVGRLLAALRAPRYFAFYALIYDTGLRFSEALNLRVGDIDRRRGVIHVRQGKGGKDRQVKLGERLYGILRDYWREERLGKPMADPLSKESFLFASATGGRLSRMGARYALHAALKEADLSKRVTPHTLRHSFATTQMEAGTGLPVVQAQLGHASIRSTQVYLHVSTRLILQAPSPLDALAP